MTDDQKKQAIEVYNMAMYQPAELSGVMNPLLVEKMPPGWDLEKKSIAFTAWKNKKRGLVIIASVLIYGDGMRWAHLSISHNKKMPTHDDLCYMKRHFLGNEAKAIMVFPAQSEHVNIHEKCLHLYCSLDGDTLPDFRIFIDGQPVI